MSINKNSLVDKGIIAPIESIYISHKKNEERLVFTKEQYTKYDRSVPGAYLEYTAF